MSKLSTFLDKTVVNTEEGIWSKLCQAVALWRPPPGKRLRRLLQYSFDFVEQRCWKPFVSLLMRTDRANRSLDDVSMSVSIVTSPHIHSNNRGNSLGLNSGIFVKLCWFKCWWCVETVCPPHPSRQHRSTKLNGCWSKWWSHLPGAFIVFSFDVSWGRLRSDEGTETETSQYSILVSPN